MLFGTSGIRGLYGKEVTESLAITIGNVFADGNVAVGRDTRTTGTSLSRAVSSGVMSRGKNVLQLGLVPTPTVALATVKNSCNGIMITASHNPGEYNGLKLFREGKEITKEEEEKIEEDYAKGSVLSEWDKVGKTKDYPDAVDEHKKMIKKLVDVDLIEKKKPKVVVDCNGAAVAIAPSLLSELGCEVKEINTETKGFSRPSEPNDENLSELKKIVKSEGADIGIGHDGDGDRAVVVDEKGEVLPLDVQLAMMIEYEMGRNSNKKIVSTVEASLMIRDLVEKKGGEISILPVGSTYISHELEKQGALFGGEPCGEYVFGEAEHHAPDGILAAAKFVEMFCREGALSELKKKYSTYPMLREKYKSEKKYEVVEKVREKIETEGKINDSDGLRVDEKDGWFLIRASGTEPYVRLTMEYKSEGKLADKSEKLRSLIKEEISKLG